MAARKGVEIPIVADASGVVREGRKVGDALDQVIDSLDDVGDASKDAAREGERNLDQLSDALGDVADDAKDTGRDVGRALDGIGDDAGDEADTLERKFSDSLKAVSKQAKTTGDDVGSHMKKGADDAEEGMKTLKENAGANFKEVGASFDGTVDGMFDSMQGFVAEATEGFGPLGLAAGAAVGVGLGILQSQLQAAADKVNELKEKAGELAVEYANATDTERWEALQEQIDELSTTLTDSKSWFEVWQSDARTAIEDVAAAIDAGVISAEEFNDVAYEPDVRKRAELLRDTIDSLNEKIDDNKQKISESVDQYNVYSGFIGQDVVTASGELRDELVKQTDAAQGVKDVLSRWLDEADATVAILEAQATAAGKNVDEYLEWKQAAADAQAASESFHDALAGMSDPTDLLDGALEDSSSKVREWAQAQADATADATDTWEDFKEDAPASVALEDMLAQLDRIIAENESFKENLRLLGERGFGALAEELKAGGPDANGAIVEALTQATDDTVQRFAAGKGYLTGKNLVHGAASAFNDDKDLQAAVTDAVGRVSVPPLKVGFTADLGLLSSQLQQQWHPPMLPIDVKPRYGYGWQ